MKKVLIISSNRLGDSILSSGLNKFFKDKGFQVTFVCGPLPFNLFKFCRNIEKIISLKKNKFSTHWLYLWSRVILNFWDYVIDLRGSAVGFFLFTKKRLIYKNLVNSELHKTKSISSLVSKKNLPPNINLDLKKKIKNVEIIKLLTKKYKSYILVAPCANWIGKTWPIERFAKLILKLKGEKKFKKSIFITIGAVNEKKKMKKLIENKSINLLDLVGKIDLIEMYFLMQKSNLFIGNDSGLMHLAALAKVPTIGLFGPSDIKKYSPFGTKTLAIKSPKSYNELMSYDGFNPKKVNSLMTGLEVDHVYKKIVNFYKDL